MAILTSIIATLRAPELEDALVDLGVRVTTRVRAALPAPNLDSHTLLTSGELAKRLAVCVATIRRLDPPHTIVGDSSTKRYDIDVVRAWLAQRQPRPTTPATTTRSKNVDVDDVLANAGLHRVS